MARSPHHITYDDLVKLSGDRLSYMLKIYPGKVQAGGMTAFSATHMIEAEKVLLKLLKRFKKDPQVDLFKEFEKLKS